MIELKSSDLGDAEASQQTWPIIVGIVIVCVFAGIVTVVMYKTGAFNKLRFVKNHLEEVEEVNKRQSMEVADPNQ